MPNRVACLAFPQFDNDRGQGVPREGRAPWKTASKAIGWPNFAECRARTRNFAPRWRGANSDRTSPANADYPYGRYAVKWTKDFFSTLLPTSRNRERLQFAEYDARLRAQENDIAGALLDVKAVLYAVGRWATKKR